MSQAFPPLAKAVVVDAVISGPSGTVGARLILDTGASATALSEKLLRNLGYDPTASTDFVHLTTASGTTTTRRLMVNRLTALGHHAIGLRVIAHTLPPGTQIDGLLGLDFFRGLALTIDFRAGQITLV